MEATAPSDDVQRRMDDDTQRQRNRRHSRHMIFHSDLHNNNNNNVTTISGTYDEKRQPSADPEREQFGSSRRCYSWVSSNAGDGGLLRG